MCADAADRIVLSLNVNYADILTINLNFLIYKIMKIIYLLLILVFSLNVWLGGFTFTLYQVLEIKIREFVTSDKDKKDIKQVLYDWMSGIYLSCTFPKY